MSRSQAEFRLSCVVADYLARALPADACWTHFPAGEARNAITGARLKRMGLQRGWPDYLVIFQGRLIGIELKAPETKGRLSAEQLIVAEGFRHNGFGWGLCRSLDDVEALLRGAGVPLVASVGRAA